MSERVHITQSAIPFVLVLAGLIALVIWSDRFAEDISEASRTIVIAGKTAAFEESGIWQFERDDRVEAAVELEGDTLYDLAVNAYRKGALDRSEDFFITLLNVHGNTPALLNYLGLINMKRGEYVTAIQRFRAALNAQNTYIPAITNLALVYSRLENYTLADSLYTLASHLEPFRFRPKMNKGIMHCRIEEWREAVVVLDSAVEVGSGQDRAKALAYRGMAHFNLRDTASAQRDFNDAINLAPAFILPRVYQALTVPESEAKLTALDKVIALDQGYAPAYFYKGVVLQQQGDIEAARRHFEQALQLNPADREVSEVLGSFYIDNDLIEYAEQYFSEVYRSDSLSPQNYFYKAKIASRRDDNQNAIALYEKAISESGGNYAEAYLNEAVLLKREGRFNEAIEAYKRAIGLRDNYQEAWYNLALTYRAIGENKEAIRCYERAIEIDPTATKAMYNLAIVLNDEGFSAKALDLWKRIIAIDPDYVKAWYNLGLYQLRDENYAESVATYRQMLERFPTYAKAWYNLGLALKETGDEDGAVLAYEEAIDLDPTYDAAWKNLGTLEAQRGNIERAIELYVQAVDLDARDAELRFNLALQFEKQGALQEALVQLNKAVQLRPSYVKAIDAWIEVATKANDELQLLLAEAHKVDLNQDGEAAYEIGRRFHKMDRFNDAISWYERAEERGNQDDWVAYWRAKAHEEAGRIDEAIEAYQLTLERDPKHKFTLYRLSLIAQGKNDELARRCTQQLIRNYPDFAAEKGITQ
jgi:tetratricopeptide (TPR) repeat protein